MKLGKINRQSIAISSITSVLKHHNGMPNELYVIGDIAKFNKTRPPVVAIVGSRKPTPYGLEATRKLAHGLAKQGVIIVSGLAYGVDAAAHQAALDAGGTTIAILAGGLHKIYPAGHQNLAQQIVESGGAIISEWEPGVEAHKYHFLARNRLVSGIADAVIVTEAAERSGTFSTVRHAVDQNVPVFAVPGPITSLLSAGPNQLLKTPTASPVTDVRDVLDVIAPEILNKMTQTQMIIGDTPLEQAILNLIADGLAEGSRIFDSLSTSLKINIAEFNQTLTYMEIKGLVRPIGGDLWAICK